MDKLFLTILNMSLTGAFVIAAICLARVPLKKAPKFISYCLWAVAGFRLAFPFSVESAFSLIPFKAQTIPQDIAAIPRIGSGIPFVNNAVSGILPAAAPPAATAESHMLTWTAIGAYIWLAGAAVMLVFGVASYILLKRKMSGAVHVHGNIYQAAHIQSPFVLGFFFPKIYMPCGVAEDEYGYIIAHERTHIRRRDHIIKLAAYLLLCLHWFNPLVYAAFILMSADMEMSCDERVLREMGGETKKAYSLSLLSLAAQERIIGGGHDAWPNKLARSAAPRNVRPGPLAFGEGGIKERVKNVLKFKKSSPLIITLAVLLAAVLSIGFALNRTREVFDVDIPDVFAISSDERTATALKFSFTWDGGAVDSVGPWHSEFKAENTLYAPDGEFALQIIGQLQAEYEAADTSDGAFPLKFNSYAYGVESVDIELFLPDGTPVPYDGDSLNVRLPDGADEYICCVSVKYTRDGLNADYGFKVLRGGAATPSGNNENPVVTLYGFNAAADNGSSDRISRHFTGRLLPEADTGRTRLTDEIFINVEIPDGTVALRTYYAEAGSEATEHIMFERNTPPYNSLSVDADWLRGNTWRVADYFPASFLGHIWAVTVDADGAEHYSDIIKVVYEPYILPAPSEQNYTYPGSHALYVFELNDGTKWTVMLSQPVRQGASGIWCVERMIDEQGNVYAVMTLWNTEVSDTAAAEYYAEQQKKADEGVGLGEGLYEGAFFLHAEATALRYLELEYSDFRSNIASASLLLEPSYVLRGRISHAASEPDTIWFDEVEWLGLQDTERLNTLGIAPNSLSNGFYINETRAGTQAYGVNKDAWVSVIDWDNNTNKYYSFSAFEALLKNDGEYYNRLWCLTFENGVISLIEEQYLP